MATQIIKALSVMACCALGTAAHAQVQATPHAGVLMSKSVAYSDLDLNSASGQKTLAVRIKAAVREVCGEPDSRDLKTNHLQQICKAEAMRSAQIQSANVVAQYNSDRGRAANNRVIVGN